MKNLLPIPVIVICLITGCNSRTVQQEPAKNYIPGTYTRMSITDRSTGTDTLKVSTYDESENTFVITLCRGFHMIRNGRLQPKQYSSEKHLTVYDEATQALQDMKTGTLYVFVPGKAQLWTSAAVYDKLP